MIGHPVLYSKKANKTLSLNKNIPKYSRDCGWPPEVGQKQKTEKKREKKTKTKVGDNNGQATHGARKHAWRTQAAWANSVLFGIWLKSTG